MYQEAAEFYATRTPIDVTQADLAEWKARGGEWSETADLLLSGLVVAANDHVNGKFDRYYRMVS